MATDFTRPLSQPDDLRERLIDAGLELLDRRGPAELTVRRIAQAAQTSTMGVYTKFGGRTGILQAIYLRGFERLRVALETAPELGDADPIRRILGLALAYRRFALANAALYAFMFERPVRDFDPSPALRRQALEATFGLLVAAVAHATTRGALPDTDPAHTSYLVWSLTHGMVSLELTHTARSPLPGWFLDTDQARERVLVDGLQATLTGLRRRNGHEPDQRGTSTTGSPW